MVNVINNGKQYEAQRIEDKPTSTSEQTRSERDREEIKTGLLEMSHTWTGNSVRFKKDKMCVQLSHFNKMFEWQSLCDRMN